MKGKLTSSTPTITGAISVEQSKLTGSITATQVALPAYTGSYEVTPSSVEQTLETNGKRMTGNVVVKKVPSNYGLITYNGVGITVS